MRPHEEFLFEEEESLREEEELLFEEEESLCEEEELLFEEEKLVREEEEFRSAPEYAARRAALRERVPHEHPRPRPRSVPAGRRVVATGGVSPKGERNPWNESRRTLTAPAGAEEWIAFEESAAPSGRVRE